MHAALSVIGFTVLSGMGLGAFAWVALADLGLRGLVPGDARFATSLVAFVLVVAGLCLSTLHLANPRNAWRAASRFATSWLSREAVFALLFCASAFAWIVARAAGADASLLAALAAVSLLLAVVVVFCTAMIYASLKPVRAWHTWRVPLNYLLLSLASGALLVAVAGAVMQSRLSSLAAIGAWLYTLAALAKLEYRHYLASGPGRVTLEHALGVDRGVRGPGAPASVAARLFDLGHSRGTFLTREFGGTPTPRARGLALLAMALAGYGLPLAWLAAGARVAGPAVLVVALLGLVAERWLFFVEAKHTVRLYHGERRV